MNLPAFLANLDPMAYMSNNYVVADFETDTSAGPEYYGHPAFPENQLLLASWRYRGETHAHWGGEFDQERLLDYIDAADFMVAHSSKYELGWLKRMGVDLRKVFVFDTKIAETILLGNLAAGDDKTGMPPRSTDLDTVCRRRGFPVKDPAVDLLIGRGINPVSIPRPWLEGRCRQDVETTERVFLHQREQLLRTNRLPVVYTRCLLTPVLAEMEFEGMALSAERVEAEHAKQYAEMVKLEQEMSAMTGGINWKSQPQKAAFLYDVLKFEELTDGHGKVKKTAGGERATSQKVLDKLQAKTPEQKAFVKLLKTIGKVNARLSKNLDFFLGVVKEYDGVFRWELHQTKTATDRLSSTGFSIPFKMFPDKKGRPQTKSVQGQNMPREYKKLLKAKRKTDDGRPYLIFEPDGSMLEFRVAAYLGQDEQAMADIADVTWDAHVTSGSEMAELPYSEVYEGWKRGDKKYDAIRQNAKPHTFKPLYGGSKGTEAEERWFEAFKRRYHGLNTVQEGWLKEVLDTKRLVTPWGKIFYWPNVRMNRFGYVNAKHSVFNYPVQSLATAEIIPIAIVYFWHRMPEAGLLDYVHLVNTIHDSVPMEVHPDHIEPAKLLAKRAFTRDVYEYLRRVYRMEFNVPLGVGMKAGEHWGEGPEESYDIYPDGHEVRRK